ncbi:MAG: hypothetical protein NC452_17205 [Eubacterium sp.]|nr:hypothetical protein [Eubacterium sp.]
MKACIKKIKKGDCAYCSHYIEPLQCDIGNVEEKSELYWLGYGLRPLDARNADCAFWQAKSPIKVMVERLGDERTEKSNEEWEKIWNDIYEFQHTLPIDSLPSDEKELEKSGLYIVYGKKSEKLLINKELSKRLFMYRCSN